MSLKILKIYQCVFRNLDQNVGTIFRRDEAECIIEEKRMLICVS